MKQYKVLITGAGSVMGQSIYKALCKSEYSSQIVVYSSNSDRLGAGLYFNQNGYKLDIRSAVQCPLANDEKYDSWLADFVLENGIDLVYSGTQHEIAKVAKFNSSVSKCAVLDESTLHKCLDKISTFNTLNRYDVYMPYTADVDSFLNSDFDFKVVAKPNYSSASRDIYILNNKKDLENCSAVMENKGRFLIQEFIDGDEYTCSCYLDKYSGLISTFVMRRELSIDGASIYGKIINDPSIDLYLDQVVSAFKQDGFEFGNLNVQLRKNNTQIGLFEINGRLSSTESPKAHFGFNTVEAYFVNMVLKKPYEGFNPKKEGEFLRYYDEVYF